MNAAYMAPTVAMAGVTRQDYSLLMVGGRQGFEVWEIALHWVLPLSKGFQTDTLEDVMQNVFGRRGSISGLVFLAVMFTALACPAPVCAEEGQGAASAQSSSTPRIHNSPDFLFGRPRGFVAMSGTWLFPRASGDLFTFIGDRLTIDRTDFRTVAGSGAVGIMVAPRFDVVTRLDVSAHGIASEYRDYVKPDRSPIAQTTKLNQTSIGVGLRFSPTGRGRDVSHYAFIPRRVVPYVGGGLNVGYYALEQRGQFVDFVDLKIFDDAFTSNGWAVGPYAESGTDLQVWRRLFVNVEARYSWMHSSLDTDFVGFHGIDLSGFKGSTGISVIF
jgi:hypothetical protein